MSNINLQAVYHRPILGNVYIRDFIMNFHIQLKEDKDSEERMHQFDVRLNHIIKKTYRVRCIKVTGRSIQCHSKNLLRYESMRNRRI